MGTILLFFATLFAIPFVLALLYIGYEKFLLWRCKLVSDEKLGLWALPFWALVVGGIQFIRLKKNGDDFLYQKFTALRVWILYQYDDNNYINLSMANDLAFEKICQIYFAKSSLYSC